MQQDGKGLLFTPQVSTPKFRGLLAITRQVVRANDFQLLETRFEARTVTQSPQYGPQVEMGIT